MYYPITSGDRSLPDSTIFMASSIDISVSIICSADSNTRNPVIGLGVCGIKSGILFYPLKSTG
jgi:hypothetical protein